MTAETVPRPKTHYRIGILRWERKLCGMGSGPDVLVNLGLSVFRRTVVAKICCFHLSVYKAT